MKCDGDIVVSGIMKDNVSSSSDEFFDNWVIFSTSMSNPVKIFSFCMTKTYQNSEIFDLTHWVEVSTDVKVVSRVFTFSCVVRRPRTNLKSSSKSEKPFEQRLKS